MWRHDMDQALVLKLILRLEDNLHILRYGMHQACVLGCLLCCSACPARLARHAGHTLMCLE